MRNGTPLPGGILSIQNGRAALPRRPQPGQVQGILDTAALATGFVPGLGEATGLLADTSALIQDPSLANLGLLGVGLATGPIPAAGPLKRLTGLAKKVQEISRFDRYGVAGSESVVDLFSSDPDAAYRLAETFDLDTVTPQMISRARNQVSAATREYLQTFPEVIPVYRGGPLRGEIVSVTTNPDVARRFSKYSSGEGVLQKFEVPKEKVLAAMEAVTQGKGGLDEAELLVRSSDLN